MIRALLAPVVLLGLASASLAGDYILMISKIEVKKTPCSGTWHAGVSIWQDVELDNRDSWQSGEKEFEGTNVVLPVALRLGGLESGEVIALFIGLDDDVNDAGSADAEDKLEFEFKVFPTSKDRIYDFARGDWSIRVHYTLTK